MLPAGYVDQVKEEERRSNFAPLRCLPFAALERNAVQTARQTFC